MHELGPAVFEVAQYRRRYRDSPRGTHLHLGIRIDSRVPSVFHLPFSSQKELLSCATTSLEDVAGRKVCDVSIISSRFIKFKSTKALRRVPEICDDGELEGRIEIDGSIAVGDLTSGVDGADKEGVSRFSKPVKPIRSTMFEESDSLRHE